jgi:hypothetical protein
MLEPKHQKAVYDAKCKFCRNACREGSGEEGSKGPVALPCSSPIALLSTLLAPSP